MASGTATSAPQDESSPAADGEDTAAPVSGLPLMSGWRLWMVVLSLCLGLLLSALETTIIATALVTISSDLGHFEKSSWIVVSYLLTYTGFLIIVSRMSDIFGRKQTLLFSLGMFTLWSAACGCARSIEQLIAFRALQGIGGSGLYALAVSVVPEITPMAQLGHASAAVSAVSACSSVLGPVLGGIITSRTTWRWVFWLNIPWGVMVIAFVVWVFPQNVGRMPQSRTLYKLIDWPGAILSLVASVTLTFALESGGVQFPWRSAAIISTFVIAGVTWVLFPLWETYLTTRGSKVTMLPIFPAARFMGHRVIAAAMVTAFFTGFPFMTVVITLPQRFQIVNGLTPVAAGTRMLPLLLLTAVGAFTTGAICSKKNVAFYLLLLSCILVVIGTALLSTLPTTIAISASQYGIQVILGFAFGMALVSLIIASRVEVGLEDHAVAMGAITQVRVLGGIIGLAIAQAILIASLRSRLLGLLTPAQLSSVLASAASIKDLPADAAALTRRVYGEAVNRQMRIVMGFAVAATVVCCFAWRRHAVKFEDLERVKAPLPSVANTVTLDETTAVELVNTDVGNTGPSAREGRIASGPAGLDAEAPRA